MGSQFGTKSSEASRESSPEVEQKPPVILRESPEATPNEDAEPEVVCESPEPSRKSLEIEETSRSAVSRSLSESSSSSKEAGQIKQSSSEVTEDTTDLSSSRPKDSSATESSQQQPGIRQDTLEEVDEDQSSSAAANKQPTFQIQHATEQEVDDFYQVQPTTANEEVVEEEPTTTKVEKDVTSEVKLESKTPPPSPAIEQGSYDMEGGPRNLEDFVTL